MHMFAQTMGVRCLVQKCQLLSLYITDARYLASLSVFLGRISMQPS